MYKNIKKRHKWPKTPQVLTKESLERFIYRSFRGVPRARRVMNGQISQYIVSFSAIRSLHPICYRVLAKIREKLMLQRCMIWSETDDVAAMPRRKRSKTTTADPFWMSRIVSQRANPDDAWDYHRNSNLLLHRWLVNAPRSKPYLGFSCRGQ